MGKGSGGAVLALILCVSCAASVAGFATAVASPGPAGPRFPLRLKGGGAKPQVARCESGDAAGGSTIVESAEMAGDCAPHLSACMYEGVGAFSACMYDACMYEGSGG